MFPGKKTLVMEIQVEESDNLTESGTDGEVTHVLSPTKGQQGQSQSQGQVKRTEVKKNRKKSSEKIPIQG